MVDLRQPLAVLATRLPWATMEAALAARLAHQAKLPKQVAGQNLAGACEGEFGGGISPAGRPRLPVRLMANLLQLKHSFNLSDEELVERWAENVNSAVHSKAIAASVLAAPGRGARMNFAGPINESRAPLQAPWLALGTFTNSVATAAAISSAPASMITLRGSRPSQWS
jgi:IS5 family transposase